MGQAATALDWGVVAALAWPHLLCACAAGPRQQALTLARRAMCG